MEEESENSIPVLDVEVTRQPDGSTMRGHRALRLGNDDDSAVVKHSMDTTHPISLELAVILGERLCTCKESIYSTSLENPMPWTSSQGSDIRTER